MKAKQYTATAQQVFRIFGPGDLYATASDIDEALRMGGKMLPIHPPVMKAHGWNPGAALSYSESEQMLLLAA